MRRIIGDWFSGLPAGVQLTVIVLLVALIAFLYTSRYGRKSKK